jgi:hypothetical protein
MPLPTRSNWWFCIKQQATEDIENIHLSLSSNKMNGPTKRHFDSNIAKGILYAITVIYYKLIKGNKKRAFMKVSFQ